LIKNIYTKLYKKYVTDEEFKNVIDELHKEIKKVTEKFEEQEMIQRTLENMLYQENKNRFNNPMWN
jgi:polyhydroxyalkanoate synthesis regulator phasin